MDNREGRERRSERHFKRELQDSSTKTGQRSDDDYNIFWSVNWKNGDGFLSSIAVLLWHTFFTPPPVPSPLSSSPFSLSKLILLIPLMVETKPVFVSGTLALGPTIVATQLVLWLWLGDDGGDNDNVSMP